MRYIEVVSVNVLWEPLLEVFFSSCGNMLRLSTVLVVLLQSELVSIKDDSALETEVISEDLGF